MTFRILPCWAFLFVVILVSGLWATDSRPRLIVLTDIGGDPDDTQSLVRLLVYANEFEIEGLIASASGTPGELKEKVTKPELIREVVEAYGKVQGNLTRHASGYPTAQQLLARIKSGNPKRGLEVIGEGHDTEGSQWIIRVADSTDERPVNIAIWGGQTDLAQALWRVREDRSDEGVKTFINKLRVHDIADQDGIQSWIYKGFPDVFYVLNKASPRTDKRESVFRGMYLGGDESLTSRQWIDQHVRNDHGPLGALYPPKTHTAPNPHAALKEGDTPSWFYFLPNGLNDPAQPSWGGWGGRFQAAENGLYRDAQDTVGTTTDGRATVWRWRTAFQNDFQARMDWTVKPSFDDANHNPIAAIGGDKSKRILHLSVQSGQTVTLDASASTDPDGDKLDFHWFRYPEPGGIASVTAIKNADTARVTFMAPRVSKLQTIHMILAVKDDGQPNLYAYRRVLVEVSE